MRNRIAHYWRRENWPWWFVLVVGVVSAGENVVGWLDNINVVVSNADRLDWVDNVFFHPAFTIVALVIGFGGLLVLGGRARPESGAQQDTQSFPVTFHAEAVRVSISQVDISGLLTNQPANESVSLVFNIANFSGLPIRVKGVKGHIAIRGERQEPPPSLVLPSDEPVEVPFQTTRPAELRQVTAGLRQELHAGGMYGKNGVTPFSLSNVKLLCDVEMPDGSEEEQELRISPSRLLLRGPLRDDNDYEAISPQSLSFGSSNWYGSDGPNEKWYETS